MTRSPDPGSSMAAQDVSLAVFDFDGTLADSLPWFLTAYGAAAARYGLRPIDLEEAAALRRCGPREVVRRLEISWWKIPLVTRYMRRRMLREIDRISSFTGAEEMLGQLAASGVTLAIVTSNTRRNVRAVLGEVAVERVEHYECDVSLFGKRRALKRVLRRSRVAAGRAIYIGDEIRDIEAARAVGIRAGAVCWGYGDADALRERNPDEVFERMEDIVESIQPAVADRSEGELSGER